MLRQFAQEVLDAEREDAAVPGIDALGQERLGAFEVGLLDELGGTERVLGDRLAALEVAEAGFGRGRLDP
jgi:hypothetical protein